MRVGTAVWMAILVVCIGATTYEMPNAVTVWHHTFRLFARGDKKDIASALPDRLAATDLEAADLLRYCLKERPRDLGELATLAEKYPQNEFFLAQLAEQLTKTRLVDVRVPLAIIDKLLTLDPNNAHYRHLRGWTLLAKPDRLGQERETLHEFEIGERLPRLSLPYSKYKQRVDRLYERALFAPWERPKVRPLYWDIETLFLRPQDTWENLDHDILDDLSKACARMGDRLVENAHDTDSFLSGALLTMMAERTRLQELDLSPTNAQEARLHLSRAIALSLWCRQWSDREFDLLFAALPMLVLLGFVLAHFVQHPIQGLMQWLMGVVYFRRHGRRSQRKGGMTFYVLFASVLGGLVGLAALMLSGITSAKPMLDGSFALMVCAWTLVFVLTLPGLLPHTHIDEYASSKRARGWGTVVCLLVWLGGVAFCLTRTFAASGMNNAIHWQKIALLLIGWSAYCLLLLAVAAYLPYGFKRIPHNRVVVPVILWIALLLAVHVNATKWRQVERLYTDLRLVRGPLPPVTRETYERVILTADPRMNQRDPNLLPEYVSSAGPDDMEALLARRKVEGRPVSEERLQSLLERCERDARPVVLRALKDPNALEVLATRAEYGDHTVKRRLEQTFQEQFVAFFKTPDSPEATKSAQLKSLLGLAGTLACISAPEEAQKRLLGLLGPVVARAKPQIAEEVLPTERKRLDTVYSFWQALGRLPAAGVSKLMKSYLRETEFFDLSGEWESSEIDLLARRLANSDRQLAEEIVEAIDHALPASRGDGLATPGTASSFAEKLAANRAANGPRFLEAIFPSLGPESIPLLSRHLHSDKGPLRAFVVRRLTSLGYEWPTDQVQALQKDSDWRVRLNALFASGEDDLKTAITDENNIVRVIAQILREGQKRNESGNSTMKTRI